MGVAGCEEAPDPLSLDLTIPQQRSFAFKIWPKRTSQPKECEEGTSERGKATGKKCETRVHGRRGSRWLIVRGRRSGGSATERGLKLGQDAS